MTPERVAILVLLTVLAVAVIDTLLVERRRNAFSRLLNERLGPFETRDDALGDRPNLPSGFTVFHSPTNKQGAQRDHA